MSESVEHNFIVGIFGENLEHNKLIGQALGAPGTKSDIQFYNRLDAELNQVFCALTPLDYPDRMKPFLQTLVLTNIHILVIDLEIGLNAIAGEIIVGMDLFHQLYNTQDLVIISGISSKNEWELLDLRDKIEKILDTTSLNDTQIIDLRIKEDYIKLKKKIIELHLQSREVNVEINGITKILIDHAFPVKGIGTVILGIIKEGRVSTGQMLELTGYNGPAKKVIIRSIQKHDRDFKTAIKGDRVGLALKGNISAEDISRDNILIKQGSYKSENQIQAKVFINQFYKPKNKAIQPGNGIQYNAIVDLKSAPFKFINGEEILPGSTGVVDMKFDKLLYHNSYGLKGIITDFNRFDNKLRIIGYFNQLINQKDLNS
ncbi:MAG: EF-Tu/IF-2/RF-3 family GTPase [Candidatus Thorarchaeota archaeon]